MNINRLRKVMVENGIDVEELASVLDKSIDGVEVLLSLKNAEYGQFGAFKAICKLCNCSADYLLGLSDTINPIGN